MKTTILAIGFFCLGVGLVVLRANRRRGTNQVFALIAALAAGWLFTIVGAIHAGEQFWSNGAGNPVPWLRGNGAATVFLVWAIWVLDGTVSWTDSSNRWSRRGVWVGLAVCGLLGGICLFTDFYVPAGSTPLDPRRGWGHLPIAFAALVIHGWVIVRIARQLPLQKGIRRVEMQFLSLNLATTHFLVVLVTSLGVWLQLPWLRKSSCFAILIAYALAAWALMFHRIFDARQIFLSLGQRVLVVLLAAVGIAAGAQAFSPFIPAPADFILAVGVSASGALWLDQKTRRWLHLGNEHAVQDLRRAIITIARTEPETARLCAAFEQLLRQECRVETATLVFDWEEFRAGSHLQLVAERPAHTLLSELGWATPESLELRTDAAGLELKDTLLQHGLGLIVTAPRGSPRPTLIVALGAKDTRWPFTHPEIQCVQNVAELMDNILARSRLAAQAAMRAKMAHLAMMSRGLAHDLKNLITPIASYLVHTRGRGEPGSAEEEVHTAARRSVGIMTDYIREAAFFANQLTPHCQEVRLAALCGGARELVAARAARRGVRLELAIEDEPLVADGVLLQRLLVNLLHNAIDASVAGDRVWLRGGRGRAGWIRLQIADEGCGIPAANLPRIFEPYFTTKEFGEEVRGFGLGLTICQKIAHLHRGTMGVESVVGTGTTFTLDLPATQPQRRAPEPAPLVYSHR